MKRFAAILVLFYVVLVLAGGLKAADAKPAPPAGQTPAAAEKPSGEAKENDTSAGDFFHQGLFGICGGRTVWWGWVLGLLLYVPGLLCGSATVGQNIRAQYEQMGVDPRLSGGAAFFSALVGAAIGFIIFWGLPESILGWCLLSVIALFAGGLASAAAAALPQRPRSEVSEYNDSLVGAGRRF